VANQAIDRLRDNIRTVFLGHPRAVDLLLTGLVARGHVLIEDVPGVGKTVLARSLAKSIRCNFSRIQLTPDLLPGDVLGVSVFDAKSGQFEFKPGPVFANIILADEINRTTPRTQSALLEAMAEEQVSVENKTYPLQRPFMVVATQNPFEFEGTYHLPENQLDRFLLRISVGYPERSNEHRILTMQPGRNNTLSATWESLITVKERMRQSEPMRVRPRIWTNGSRIVSGPISTSLSITQVSGR